MRTETTLRTSRRTRRPAEEGVEADSILPAGRMPEEAVGDSIPRGS